MSVSGWLLPDAGLLSIPVGAAAEREGGSYIVIFTAQAIAASPAQPQWLGNGDNVRSKTNA